MSVVAIVGRPNVGKSALFNRLIGKRKALVSDMPGVTRDRHYAQAEWSGTQFTLIDTGGLSFGEGDTVEAGVHKQSMVALSEADVVICLFDGRDGVTHEDRDIVDLFRKSGKKSVYVVNKIDTAKNEDLAIEFSELGVDLLPISAEHGRNIDSLLDRVVQILPLVKVEAKGPPWVRIALVGRPNVGKSTIINHLAREERVVAHELPGTTRDTIDVEVTFEKMNYIFVDTAGIKKRAKTREKIDKFAILKSLRAIEDADIVFVVSDAKEGFARQDISLAAHTFSSYKPVALLVNKWDLVKAQEKGYIRHIRENLKELHGLPVLCISGKTGYNCEKIFNIAAELDGAKRQRIGTSELNRFVGDLVENHPVPDWRGCQVKLNYITQADVDPPVFVAFTNQPGGIAKSYKRFLINGLRRLLGGPQVPIILRFKSK